MIENFIILMFFLIVDVVLSIKRVPIVGFIIGISQFLFTTVVLLADSDINIIFTMISALMVCIVIILNALELNK